MFKIPEDIKDVVSKKNNSDDMKREYITIGKEKKRAA